MLHVFLGMVMLVFGCMWKCVFVCDLVTILCHVTAVLLTLLYITAICEVGSIFSC